MKDNKLTTRKLTFVAVLAAVATLLYLFLEIPLPVFPGFLKLNFSDLPAVIVSFAYGPVYGIAVELVKSLLHFVIKTNTYGVGELADFLVGAAYVLPAGLLYMRRKNRSGALLGMSLGVICMTVVAAFANYFVLLPFYITVMGWPESVIIGMCSAIIPAVDTRLEVVLYSMTPFNIFKGLVISVLTYLLYKRISNFLHGR